MRQEVCWEDFEETSLHEPRDEWLEEGMDLMRGERRKKGWNGRGMMMGQEDGDGDNKDEDVESGGEAGGA